MLFLLLLLFNSANSVIQTKEFIKRRTVQDSLSSSSGYRYSVTEKPSYENERSQIYSSQKQEEAVEPSEFSEISKQFPFEHEFSGKSFTPGRSCLGPGCSSLSEESRDLGGTSYQSSSFSSNGNGNSGFAGDEFNSDSRNGNVGNVDRNNNNNEWKSKAVPKESVKYSGSGLIDPTKQNSNQNTDFSQKRESRNGDETRTFYISDNDDPLRVDLTEDLGYRGRPQYGMYPYLDTGDIRVGFDEGLNDKIAFPSAGQNYPPSSNSFGSSPFETNSQIGNSGGIRGESIVGNSGGIRGGNIVGNSGGIRGGSNIGGGNLNTIGQPIGLYPLNQNEIIGKTYAYGNYPYHFVKNDGHAYKAEEQSKGGKKGETKYKSVHGYDKGEKGSYATEANKDYFNQNGGHKKGGYSSSDFGGNKFEESKNFEGGKAHEKKGHSKGTKVTGYHKVFDKDEFKKDNTFYDETDQKGHFKKFSKNYGHHGAAEGGQKQGGKIDSGFQEKGGGQKKGFKKDHFAENEQGYTGKKGEDVYHDNHSGFKGEQGKTNGKTYGYGGQSGQSDGFGGSLGGQGGNGPLVFNFH